MKAVLFTTAEYAMVSNDGQLSIIGIFDSIQASEFPAVSPRMFLVGQFKATPDEYGQVYEIHFQLVNEDGENVVSLSGAGEVPDSDLGLSVLMNQVVTLNNITFDRPGQYAFRAYLDGDLAVEMPFTVVETRKPTNQV